MEEKVIERLRITKDGIFITNPEFIEQGNQEEFHVHQPNKIEFRFQNSQGDTYSIGIKHRTYDDDNKKNKKRLELEIIIKHDKDKIIVYQIKNDKQEESLIMTFEKIKATKPWWHDREQPSIELPMIDVSLIFDFLSIETE